MSRHTFSAVKINKVQGRDGIVLSQRVAEGTNVLVADDCAGEMLVEEGLSDDTTNWFPDDRKN